MGREIKRVALDFAWPMSKVWEGFIHPPSDAVHKCAVCDGNGESPQYRFLYDQWYGNAAFEPRQTGSVPFTPDIPAVRQFAERNVSYSPTFYGSGERAIIQEAQRLCALWNGSWSHHLDPCDVAALVKADRLWDFTRTVRSDSDATADKHPNGLLKKNNGYMPPPSEVNLWSIAGFGHDSINAWTCCKAKCKRLKYPTQCAACKGEGEFWDSPEAKRLHESWKETPPPVGDGWQVWETVSEGSPVTPVFATAEALIDHLAQYGIDWDQKRGDPGWGRKSAEAFVRSEWAPSAAVIGNQFVTGHDVPAALEERA